MSLKFERLQSSLACKRQLQGVGGGGDWASSVAGDIVMTRRMFTKVLHGQGTTYRIFCKIETDVWTSTWPSKHLQNPVTWDWLVAFCLLQSVVLPQGLVEEYCLEPRVAQGLSEVIPVIPQMQHGKTFQSLKAQAMEDLELVLHLQTPLWRSCDTGDSKRPFYVVWRS